MFVWNEIRTYCSAVHCYATIRGVPKGFDPSPPLRVQFPWIFAVGFVNLPGISPSLDTTYGKHTVSILVPHMYVSLCTLTVHTRILTYIQIHLYNTYDVCIYVYIYMDIYRYTCIYTYMYMNMAHAS